MLVVTLSGFIVVAHHANPVNDESKPIFEAVRTATNGTRHLPDTDFYESLVFFAANFLSLCLYQPSLHPPYTSPKVM